MVQYLDVGSLFVMGLLLLVRLYLSHIQATKKEFKAAFVVSLVGSITYSYFINNFSNYMFSAV